MIRAHDLFCGAGGSTSGLHEIPGVQVVIAANHWQLAIETHNRNHDTTSHDCADVSQVDPRRYPPADLLWASPECTNHSQARGKRREDAQADLFGDVLPDEAAERSRATMWDVVRFAEYHRYRAVIVENVVDAYRWPPFHSWLSAMHDFGYSHRIVWLNSMHAQAGGLPAPQSRDRMYVVFWRKGERVPDIEKWTRPSAWCTSCEAMVSAVQVFKRQDRPAWGRYRSQYLYRCPNANCHQIVEPAWLPAAAAIDWTLPGERIGDRDKPLAAKTIMRIEAGLRKFARPIHVEAGGNQYDAADPKYRGGRSYFRAWPADEVLRTLHTAPTKGVAYPPMLIPVEGRANKQAASARAAMRTQTARNETGLLVPAGGTWNDTATPTDEPMRTRTTRDTEGIVIPLRNNNTPKSVVEPLDTFAAAGLHHGFVMRNNNGTGGDGSEMCTTFDEYLRTLTTKGHQSLVQWMLVPYYGNGSSRSVAEAMNTVTTKDRNALVGADVAVEDCYFRMLEPHEIKVGMAFSHDYVLLGNKREQVRLAGNAVTPPAARDLGSAVVEALLGEVAA